MFRGSVLLAIGRDGQNVRLAWKLTGVKIDIVGLDGEKIEQPVDRKNMKKRR